MNEYNDLINHWRQYKPKYLKHEKDVLPTNMIVEYSSLNEYIESVDYFNSFPKSHIGLLPVPYCGDIKNAQIYFLLLNPGFSPQDYSDESNADYKKVLINNIFQQNNEFAFFPLNPKYCWTGAARWWHRKLKLLINTTKDTKKCSYKDACSFLSTKICALELFPYHSQHFSISEKKLSEIQSVKLIKRYVLKQSKVLKKKFVVMRKINYWGLGEGDNITTFTPGEARGAHISKEIVQKILRGLNL